MRVLVAGGGIGGLTTAIALRHQGIDALVLEQAKVLTEIGAGIQIAANAAIVLRELGLESAIRAVGVKPQVLRLSRPAHRQDALPGAARRRGGRPLRRADVQHPSRRPGPDPVRCGAARSQAVRRARCRGVAGRRRRRGAGCRTARRCAATCWSAATASIRWCVSICAARRRSTSPTS